jgi:hypothetical protein
MEGLGRMRRSQPLPRGYDSSRPVLVLGHRFESVTQAARVLRLPRDTVWGRCRSRRPGWTFLARPSK